MSSNLTEEQKQAIENYSDRISTLKDFVSAVRKRPGQFIGPIHGLGVLNMIREIVQNSLVDQVVDPDSPCNWTYIYYNMQTLEVIVKDNGLGFPFNDMVRIITSQYTSKNYERKKGEYPAGYNGIGAKIVNALSTYMTIESYKFDGKAMKLELEKGYPKTSEPKPIKNPTKYQGSVVKFIPDLDVMGDVDLPYETVYTLIRRILSLTPLGTSVDFEAVDLEGKTHKEHMVNKDGIIDDLINKVKSPICKPIMIFNDDGDHKLEAAICFDMDESAINTIDVTSFSNFCPTKEGTHIDGTIDGICKWFVNYMNKIYLTNQKSKDKTVSISNDIKSGLKIMIHAAHLEPQWTGQAKEILSNPDMVPFCRQTVMSCLDEWAKSNPNDLSKLCKYFKDIADARLKMDKEKVKIVAKYQQNSLTGMPTKYVKPTKECRELIIVEGDSAGGSAKSGRDVTCQGIFPIRGKIPSAFEKTKQAFWDNQETQGIAKIILGRDYVKNFDPIKDVKWEKIIFMADADVDGSHISSLLLRFFILYMPQLIEAGKVYKALPPLYSTKNGKKITYFTNQMDFVRFVQKNFVQNNTITEMNGKQLASKDMTILFLRNEDYVYELERLAMTYAVDPYLLEIALYSYINKVALKSLQKDVKNKFRFMNVNKVNETYIYDGTIKEYNFLFMNDRLFKDCTRLLNIMNSNTSFYYKMNGQPSTLYDIMKKFENSTPSNIQRYKGLGEMDADQLAMSTLRPDSDRTLIQYTIEDMKAEFEAIRSYESDRSKLLDHIGVVKRSDLAD